MTWPTYGSEDGSVEPHYTKKTAIEESFLNRRNMMKGLIN